MHSKSLGTKAGKGSTSVPSTMFPHLPITKLGRFSHRGSLLGGNSTLRKHHTKVQFDWGNTIWGNTNGASDTLPTVWCVHIQTIVTRVHFGNSYNTNTVCHTTTSTTNI